MNASLLQNLHYLLSNDLMNGQRTPLSNESLLLQNNRLSFILTNPQASLALKFPQPLNSHVGVPNLQFNGWPLNSAIDTKLVPTLQKIPAINHNLAKQIELIHNFKPQNLSDSPQISLQGVTGQVNKPSLEANMTPEELPSKLPPKENPKQKSVKSPVIESLRNETSHCSGEDEEKGLESESGENDEDDDNYDPWDDMNDDYEERRGKVKKVSSSRKRCKTIY